MKDALLKLYRETPWIAVDLYNKYWQEKYDKAIIQNKPLFKAKKHLEFQLKQDLNPLFYFGNPRLKNPIVTVSLNPGLGENTYREQQSFDLDDWFNICEKGTLNYDRDEEMHRVFKNTGKVLFGNEKWSITNSKRELFYENIVNLDFCPLYSTSFPSNFWDLGKKLEIEPLLNHWNGSLQFMISHLKPRMIFVHGSVHAQWLEKNTEFIRPIAKLSNDRGREFSVTMHEYRVEGCKPIKLIYSSHFVNLTTKEETVEELHRIVMNALNA